MISWKRSLHRLLFLVSYCETSEKALAFLQCWAACLLPPLWKIRSCNSPLKRWAALGNFSSPKLHHTQSLNLSCTFFFLYIFFNYKLSSPLYSSFRFRFSPAWQETEVGISIAFTSSPSPHISGWWCFSLHQTTQNLTWGRLDKATVLLSKGLIAHQTITLL